MKARYKATLPVEIDGVRYEYGSVIELDAETAKEYMHALVPLAPLPEAEKEDE